MKFTDTHAHKNVLEIGTEGGAGTMSTLCRSGPDVYLRVKTLFLFLITHED